jgi:hypothetical protein
MLLQWRSAAFVAWAMAVAFAASAFAQTFAPARDELLVSRAVTIEAVELWAEEFLSFQPEVESYEAVEPNHLVIKTRAGAEIDFYLDNLLARLSEPGAERGRVLADFEASFFASFTAALPPAPVLDNVMPIVRHRDILAAYLERAEQAGGGAAEQPVHRALAGDLVEILAYDTPTGIGVMSKRSLGLEAMDDAAAFALARANFARMAEALEWIEEDGFRVATLDGNYESSALLLDRVWDELAAEMGGAIAVAAPARDFVVAARADNPEHVDVLRGLAEEAPFNPYGLSSFVFVRSDGRWEVLE